VSAIDDVPVPSRAGHTDAGAGAPRLMARTGRSHVNNEAAGPGRSLDQRPTLKVPWSRISSPRGAAPGAKPATGGNDEQSAEIANPTRRLGSRHYHHHHHHWPGESTVEVAVD
jgi:hypothetical protein